MKHILMVLASQRFRDIEYIVPRAFFEQAGHKVSTVSSTKESTGRFGYKVTNDFTLDQIDQKNFDGIYFVGGAGSLEYLDSDLAKSVFTSFIEAGKPVSAICAAPKNFLKWGFLKGRPATGHNGDGSFVEMAKEYGAIAQPEKTIVRDGQFLTGNGPEASEESAKVFMEMLN